MNPLYTLKAACLLLMLPLMSCTSFVQQNQARDRQVEVALNTFVSFPPPAQLGKTLSVSQLIRANWGSKRQSFPVHLEVSENQVLLLGFSNWGTRILTLTYTKKTLIEEVLPGLNAVLPQGKEVLFNMMLALWPLKSWNAPLNAIDWTLVEGENYRNLLNEKGETVIVITYSNSLKFKNIPSVINFKHVQQDYEITIETFQ